MKTCLFFILIIFIQIKLFSIGELKQEDKRVYISSEDKEILNTLFGTLISEESLGYVLCGDKPVGFTSLSTNLHLNTNKLNNAIFKSLMRNYILLKGWIIWEKYQSKIDNSNFILLRHNGDEGYFINKKAVLETVYKNLNVFKRKLYQEITPNQILNIICNTDLQQNIIYHSDHLLGILLGYGAENCKAYNYRGYLINQLQNPLFSMELSKLEDREQKSITLCNTSITDGERNLSFNRRMTLSKAWKEIERKSDSFPNEPYEYQENLNITWPLSFFIINTESSRIENSELLRKYQDARKVIAETYRNRNFLDETLRIFLSNEFVSPQTPSISREKDAIFSHKEDLARLRSDLNEAGR